MEQLLVVEDDSRDDLVLMEVDQPVEQLLVVEDDSRDDLVLMEVDRPPCCGRAGAAEAPPRARVTW